MVSCHHCGNHSQQLIDTCVIAACDEDLYAWLAAGSFFYRMGGAFLRLVQVVSTVIESQMIPPIAMKPPVGALAILREVCDYCVSNFKSYADDQCQDE